jgi:hypothetical protein
MDTNKEYAELMEMKTNKAAKEIVHLLYKENLQPMAAIVSIIKASAIILESCRSTGEDADYLESLIVNMIKPARLEVREKFNIEEEVDKIKN